MSAQNSCNLSSCLVGDITLSFLSCPKYTNPTLSVHSLSIAWAPLNLQMSLRTTVQRQATWKEGSLSLVKQLNLSPSLTFCGESESFFLRYAEWKMHDL